MNIALIQAYRCESIRIFAELLTLGIYQRNQPSTQIK